MSRVVQPVKPFLNSLRKASTITTKLPQVTGNGPFLEQPTFSAVGSPPSLLDIKLPLSAIINLRLSSKSSIVGINGEIENLNKEVTMTTAGHAGSAAGKPILYQRIFNPTPISLLISNHLNLQNFLVLKLNSEGSNWFIKDANLVAWQDSIKILPQLSNKLLDSSFSTISASGQGSMALRGSGLIFEISLGEDESLLVNPKNLLAYNGADIATIKFQKTLLDLKLPTFTLPQSFKIYYAQLKSQLVKLILPKEKIESVSLPEAKTTLQTPAFLNKFKSYLLKKREQRFSDKLFKVKGPLTLIVQNNV